MSGRFTAWSEYYTGNFGNYFPDGGYYQDFFPYDVTRKVYQQQIEDMIEDNFVEFGKTKMIDIDFSMAVPATNYFASVNMMIELTPSG